MCICTSPKLSDDKDRNLIVKVFLKMVHVIYSHIITPQESSFKKLLSGCLFVYRLSGQLSQIIHSLIA